MEPFRVFIGYDGAEDRAAVVCAKSLQRRSSIPLQIRFLRQEWLRAIGVYWRFREALASTEFTYTRFLVPALCGYHGPALFVDADFLFLADIGELATLYDPHCAVQVVQHEDYQPTEMEKMGGLVQTSYPRKNWSSLMLLRADHPACKALTPWVVNTQTGAYLHRLAWAPEGAIGALPPEWNVLEGVGPYPPKPKAIHFTRGVPTVHPGPFAFSELWEKELAR